MQANISVDGFRGIIDDQKVVCLICGQKEFSLTEHLKEKHHISPGQYKQTHPKAVLFSPIVAELLHRMKRTPKQSDDLGQFVNFFENKTEFDDLFNITKGRLPPVQEEQKDLIPKLLENFSFPGAETRGLLTGLILGKNSYISGPTGCGKTELVYQIHAKLQRPMVRVNMNGGVTQNSFLGSMKVDPIRGTYFQEGVLPRAMKGNYTLLVDEIDYTPPNIAAVLNPVMEGKKVLYLEGTGELIQAGPGFTIIGTANTGGKGDAVGSYSGTEILNTAFLDRFGIKLSMDYLPDQIELDLLKRKFPDNADDEIRMAVKAATEIRTAFKQGTISMTMSTRKLIDFFQIRPTLGITESLNLILLNWMDNDDRDVVVTVLKHVGYKL